MDGFAQLVHMRSHARRAELESWLGATLPFDDEVLTYLLRLSKMVDAKELGTLVADFCPNWPEGLQLALAASLSQATPVRVERNLDTPKLAPRQEPKPVFGRRDLLSPPKPCSWLQDWRDKLVKPQKRHPSEPTTRQDTPAKPQKERIEVEDLQQAIKDIVQQQLAQRPERSPSPKRVAPAPDPEAERMQKCTSAGRRDQSFQEVIQQQLLLQEQLRQVDEGGRFELDSAKAASLSSEPELKEGALSEPLAAPIGEPKFDPEGLGSLSLDGASSSVQEPVKAESPRQVLQERRCRDRPAKTRGSSTDGSGQGRIPKLMDISVSLPDGITVALKLPREATASQLKRRLEAEWGLPARQLCVAYLGLSLKDHWRLTDCGIKAHDRLQASWREHHG
ncbi:unnamed protein product, partial [Effrenium voratum]